MHIIGFEPRLAEIGQIKIGKKVEGKGYPQKLDHFMLCMGARDGQGNMVRNDDLHKTFGDKPTELPVVLLYDDIELNMPHYYAYYAATRWICKGDGKVATRREIDPETKKVLETKETVCPCNFLTDKDEKGATRCKPCGILQVMLRGATRTGGHFAFRTHSWNSLRDLLGSMMFIQNVAYGKLAGIPLTLMMKPTAGKDASGKTTMNWTVTLVFNGDPTELRKFGLEALKLESGYKNEMKMLTAGAESLAKSLVDEPEEEERHIAEEYYPHGEVAPDAEEAEATITEETPAPPPRKQRKNSPAPAQANPSPPPQQEAPPPPTSAPAPGPVAPPESNPAKDAEEIENLFGRLGINAARQTLLRNKYKTPAELIPYLYSLLAQRGA